MNKFWSSAAFAAVLFAVMLLAGLHLSRKKPMWDDELYSLECSIEARGYGEILRAPFWSPGTEGNASPIFYLFQKAWNSAIGASGPVCPPKLLPIADQGVATGMRLPHILALSLAVAVGAFWCAARWGLGAAACLALLSLGSAQYWVFLAEMRPYAGWILLSSLQTILVFESMEQGMRRGAMGILGATHLILAFFISLSIVQIFAAFLALLLVQPKKWAPIMGACAPALLVCVIYAMWRESYRYWIPPSPGNLLFANFAKSKAVLFVVLMAGPCWMLLRPATRRIGWASARSGLFAVFVTGGMAAVLFWFWREHQFHPRMGAFELPSRYFLALAPVANLTLARMVARKTHHRGLLALTILVLVYQCGRTYLDVRGMFY